MSFSVLSSIFIIIASASHIHGNPWVGHYERNIPTDFTCPKPGNFSHPTVCSSYIYCDTKLVPSEKLCPPCDNHPIRCPESRLYYDRSTQQCTWADQAKCPHPTTTTQRPTTTSSHPGECIVDCQQTGDCACYDTCVPDSSSSTGGRWSKQYCNDDLYWNPDKGPHGGVCDFWENLSDVVKEKYRNDDNCPGTPGLPCSWRKDVVCDNKYYYLPEDSKNVASFELNLACPKSSDGRSLFWNQDAKTCQFDCTNPAPCKVC